MGKFTSGSPKSVFVPHLSRFRGDACISPYCRYTKKRIITTVETDIGRTKTRTAVFATPIYLDPRRSIGPYSIDVDFDRVAPFANGYWL